MSFQTVLEAITTRGTWLALIKCGWALLLHQQVCVCHGLLKMSIRLSTVTPLRPCVEKVASPRLANFPLTRNYRVASSIYQQSPTRTLDPNRTKISRQHLPKAPIPRTIAPHSTVQMQPYSTQPSPEGGEPIIHDVFESNTGTWQYVVADPSTLDAIIIDPVLDYDPSTQTISTHSADALILLAKENNYIVKMILETHAHADHITAASYLQSRLAKDQGFKPRIGIGKRIGQVQETFARRYGVPSDEYHDVYDILFNDDQGFKVGDLSAKAIHLPGHTPDHLGYKIGGKSWTKIAINDHAG